MTKKQQIEQYKHSLDKFVERGITGAIRMKDLEELQLLRQFEKFINSHHMVFLEDNRDGLNRQIL